MPPPGELLWVALSLAAGIVAGVGLTLLFLGSRSGSTGHERSPANDSPLLERVLPDRVWSAFDQVRSELLTQSRTLQQLRQDVANVSASVAALKAIPVQAPETKGKSTLIAPSEPAAPRPPQITKAACLDLYRSDQEGFEKLVRHRAAARGKQPPVVLEEEDMGHLLLFEAEGAWWALPHRNLALTAETRTDYLSALFEFPAGEHGTSLRIEAPAKLERQSKTTWTVAARGSYAAARGVVQ